MHVHMMTPKIASSLYVPEIYFLFGQAFLIIKDPAPVGFVGNRTECALLMMLRTWDADYTVIREKNAPMVERVWDFDSAKKMASVLIRTSDGYRLYNKASLLQLHSLVQLCTACCTRLWDLLVHDLAYHVVHAVQLYCCHCWVVAECVTQLQCWTEASIPGTPSMYHAAMDCFA